jgi:hypothetical protein
MTDDLKLLISKQILIQSYSCINSGKIYSNIGDMWLEINKNETYCYTSAGYSAPL